LYYTRSEKLANDKHSSLLALVSYEEKEVFEYGPWVLPTSRYSTRVGSCFTHQNYTGPSAKREFFTRKSKFSKFQCNKKICWKWGL